MTMITNFQVPTHLITAIPDLTYEKSSKNAFKVSLINTSVYFLIAVVIATVVYSFLQEHYLIILAVLSVLTLLTIINVVYSWYYYKNLSYALREKDITLKEGVIFRSETTMPYIRVQHSEVNQSLIQRYFKIASLHLYTAGGSGVDMTISGLDEERAERIKDFIIGNNTQASQLNGEEE